MLEETVQHSSGNLSYNVFIAVESVYSMENGRGRVCELGLEDKVFIRLHTFGKALACNGGKSISLLANVFSSLF